MNRRVFILVCLLGCILTSTAQDLNARVEVSAPQVQNINSRVIDNLKNMIYGFLNSNSWSKNSFQPEERIDCSFNFIISSFDGVNQYSGSLQVNSARPVFGTNYNSPILSFRDKYINFSYTEGEQLIFSENQEMSSLPSILAYYAYIIVGMDLDSFKPSGGSEMYQKAKNILNFAQSSQMAGWRGIDATDNRYWLVENLNDRKYNSYREFSYQFHREGLDKMSENEHSARTFIIDLLSKLKEVDRFNTGNVLSTALFTAKSNEFVGLFSKMPRNESVKIYNLLVELDPSNSTKYDKIRN